MRRVPGAPKGRPGPTIAPQHRMVFGLLVMASAAFVLSVAFSDKQPKDEATETPALPSVVVSRVVLPSPTPGRVQVGAVATDAVLDGAVRELRAALDACTQTEVGSFGDKGGELRVDLVLDSGGLRRAELVGAHLPEQPALDCLAAAVHAHAWPTVVGDPMELRVPFFVVLPLGAAAGAEAPPLPPQEGAAGAETQEGAANAENNAENNAEDNAENDDGPPEEGEP